MMRKIGSATRPPRKRSRDRSIGGSSARSTELSRGTAGPTAEELFDRVTRAEVRSAHTGDGELAQDRVAPGAIAVVRFERRRDDDGLRRDRRFAERACRAYPRRVERWRDEQDGRAPAQAREGLDDRLRKRARTGEIGRAHV